ncbi:MAG: glycosyltransferase family 39 protein [Planctomycetia bacterium]|nr:glycosyltransferase family 39 protein [Planctomycetia bacterium]MBL6915669.1 glycosyltransferase family 39 protein [Planctomycetota bacterium]
MSLRINDRSFILFAVAVWAGFLFVRATGPDDIYSRDQIKVAAYVLDIVENDAWLWQEDHQGNFASKPPLTQWLGAAATQAYGEFHRLTLSFPSWLATLVTILLLMGWTAREFGRGAALWLPLLFLANNMGIREILLARSDTLFQCTIVVIALGSWHAWMDGDKAWWVAVGSLAALMTKGPLGILLGLLGLLSCVFRNKENPATIRRLPWKKIVIALLLASILPALWLYQANLDSDGRAVAKLIHDELIEHAIGEREEDNQQVWWHHLLPIAWFLTKLAPASLFALSALKRIFKNPRPEGRERRSELFVTTWLLGGLALLCLGTHHRFVHLLAILPPTAILASRQIAMWWQDERKSMMWATVCLSLVLPLVGVYLNIIDVGSKEIVLTEKSRAFTSAAIKEAGSNAQFEFFEVHAGLQVHLSQHKKFTSAKDLSNVLESDQPLYLIADDEQRIRELAGQQDVEIIDVALRYPTDPGNLIMLASKGASGTPREQKRRAPSFYILTLLSIATSLLLYGSQNYARKGLSV